MVMTKFKTEHLVQQPWPSAWDDGVLVLDLLNHDPVVLDLSSLPLHECLPSGVGDNANLMPVLLDLAKTPPDMRHALAHLMWRGAQRADPPVVCARLQGPAPIQDVATHLAGCLIGTDHRQGQALWRFYDPRVFIHMAWLLRPAQLHALYGPCETWGLAWAGDWYELERPAAPAQSGNTDPRPWWPDAKQWPSIEHVVDIEQVLARIASPAKPSIAQAPNVDRLLRFATEDLHIRSDTDRRHYATYAAAFGQPFEQHAKLQALWPAVASGEVTLRQAMAQLSTNDWELMRIMARTAKQTQSPTQHG